MCLGIPGRVVRVLEGNAGMLEDMAVESGEWVLIHMGFVVERVDEAAAEKAMTGLEPMGRERDG